MVWNAELGVEVQLGVQAVFDPVRLRAQKRRGRIFKLNVRLKMVIDS